jgi:alkaline phosphatase
MLVLAALAAAVPLCLGAAAGAAAGAAPTSGVQAPHKPLARNVIVLLDDGGGYNQHEAGSLYDTGDRAGEIYHGFPFQTAMSTYSYGIAAPVSCPAEPTGYDASRAWTEWDYVNGGYTDSAAAATAMATGTKTYNGAIGVACDGTTFLPNIVESFEAKQMSTGLVTSSAVSNATPAAFSVHNASRTEEPAISNSLVDTSALDVVMGVGHPFYGWNNNPLSKAQYNFISRHAWDELVAGTPTSDADGDGVADPFTLVQTRQEFADLTTGDTPKRVFGVPQVHKNLQADRTGDLMADPYVVPFLDAVPTLSEMTLGALNVLDQNPTGFFLMAESGGTDVAAAEHQTGRMLEEELSFDRMVDAVNGWVEQHSNWGETLVVVLSDHETAYLTGPDSGPTADGPVWTPLTNNGQGVVPGLQFNSTHHTNSLVPVFAKGDAGRLLRTLVGGTDSVRGAYLDNTAIYRFLMAVADLG